MDPGSNQHNRRLDQELAHEARGLTEGGQDEGRPEDWRELEPSADDHPAAPSADDAGQSDDEPVTDRDALARVAGYLRRSIFPATGTGMVEEATDNQAPDDILDDLRRLPPTEVYENIAEAWAKITGRPVAREDERF
jgi:hypothetical protein